MKGTTAAAPEHDQPGKHTCADGLRALLATGPVDTCAFLLRGVKSYMARAGKIFQDGTDFFFVLISVQKDLHHVASPEERLALWNRQLVRLLFVDGHGGKCQGDRRSPFLIANVWASEHMDIWAYLGFNLNGF